jgi:hypothetical protein
MAPNDLAGPKSWSSSKKSAGYRFAPTPEIRCDRCIYMWPHVGLGGAELFAESSAPTPPVNISHQGKGAEKMSVPISLIEEASSSSPSPNRRQQDVRN